MDTIRSLILTMRPKQWTKNILFVFPAIIFSARLLELDSLIRVVVACILLILTSGCVYIINDLADLESDKLHPVKRTRPLAAGKLSPQAAKVAALVLPLLILYAAYSFDLQLTLVLLAYFALQIAYSLYVKHMVILDILAVAAGFVLRLVAGASSLMSVSRPGYMCRSDCSRCFS